MPTVAETVFADGRANRVQAFPIARDTEPLCVIVLTANAPLSERHAATELAEFLHRITQSEIPVVNQLPRDRPRILIGPDAARLVDADFSIDGLGEEGFSIRVTERDLILAGGRPRGTLYAVEDLLKVMVVNVRQWLERQPDIDYFWISQNDWGGPCQCKDCRKVDDAEGSPAGTLLRFVNAVAEALEPEFPAVTPDRGSMVFFSKARDPFSRRIWPSFAPGFWQNCYGIRNWTGTC